MTAQWIRFAMTALCLFAALTAFTAAVIGANRFGFIMNRIHAAGIGDTLGIFLVALALVLGTGFGMPQLKMIMIIVFLWFTSPVSSHFVIQIEYFTNPHLERNVNRIRSDEREEVQE